MNSLRTLLNKPLNNIPLGFVIVLFVIALVGFADSTYLAIEHIRGSIPPCSVLEGCDTVLTSKYAVVAGIPVALFGSIYYFIIMAGLLAYFESKRQAILPYIFVFTVLGLVASLWFVFLQVFIIGSICMYCMGSAITSTLLFVMSVYAFRKYS